MRDKITPKKLNKSADERLISNTGLIDALNVLITSSEGETGNEGVVKAARGNTAITYVTSTGTGTAKVIGSVTDQRLKVIYMFLYSSVPSEHGVYVYDPYGNLPNGIAGQVRKVYTSSRFAFDEFGFVKGDVVYINNTTDTTGAERFEKDCILYFTDGRSEPKKLNVFRCLKQDENGALTDIPNDQNETDFITACPKLGLKTLFARFTGDSTRSSSNFVNTKGFQFAYQLIYKDGVETAISPYSDILFPTVIIKQGAQEVVDYTANNVIEIDFDTDVQNRTEIEKIRLLAREGNDGFFFAIDEFKKDENIILGDETTIWNGADFVDDAAISTLTYKFYNDRVVTGVDPNEVAKQYDGLPKLAAAQAVINNRLMYGNYVDGFDEQSIVCSSSLVFKERPDDFISGTIKVSNMIREIPSSNYAGGVEVPQFNKTTTYKIDCSEVPDLEEDTLINLTIQILPQQNFHLYDARESYHQNAVRGGEDNYNFFFSDGQYSNNNLGPHAETYQSPEAAGEGFLLKAPGHGNDGNQYFPLFGNNSGVIPGLKWFTVDGPPSDGEFGTNYIGRNFDAVVGTSAANPFIIPAAGSGGQLSFSVTLKTNQTVTSKIDIANALAAALSGTTDLTSIGLSAFQLISADIVPTISVDQGYENFQTFYDRDIEGKLVMSLGRKDSGAPTAIAGEGGGAVGGNDGITVEQTDGAPIGYVLLNKAEIDFMFEQHWDLDLYAGETENTRAAGSGSSGPVAEVRLGVKDMSGIEFATCMRRLDTRSLKQSFSGGNNPGDHSKIPMMANGQFDVFDNSPWFVLKNSLLNQPSFSLSQYQSNLPAAPSGPSSGDSLKKYLVNSDDGAYAYLADDINFTLFRYAPQEIKDASPNVKQLSWPDCALSMTTPMDYLGGIDFVAQGLDGPTDYAVSYDPSAEETLQGEPFSENDVVSNSVAMCNRPYYLFNLGARTFPTAHSIFPSDNFRFACGKASISTQGIGAGFDGYNQLQLQAEEGQPSNTASSDYYDNVRFKFSLLDGAGGPGGTRRISQGQPSIYGSVSYWSTKPAILANISNSSYSDGIWNALGAANTMDGHHGVVMTGTFWNGNILSADFCGYGTKNVGGNNPSDLDDLNGVIFTLNGFQPLLDAGYTTSRSQDAFFMPGVFPVSIMQNETPYVGLPGVVDDCGTSSFNPQGNRNRWDNPDYAYRPLLAMKKVLEYAETDDYLDANSTGGEFLRKSAAYIQNRLFTRKDEGGRAEHSSFGSLVSAGDLEDRTFKASAFHDFGIVYYDERGRHGFVNPATTVYVPGYSNDERGSGDNKGKVEIKLDFTGTIPPSWAKYYKLVYAPNSTVDFFVQHMAGGAYTPSFAAEGGSSVIYVSLNYLQESVVSYTSAFGARGLEGELNIYKYKEGDRVRVISYSQGEDRVYPNSFEFDIIDVKNFGPFENPLWGDTDSTAPNWLQGQFLVLRNNPLAAGFSFDNVSQGNHYWADNCLMEIYSPKKRESETAVYYEIPDQSYAGADFLPYVAEGKLYPESVTVTSGDTWWRPIAMNVRKQETGNENLDITNISNAGFVDVIKDTPADQPAGTNPYSAPNFLPVTAESMTASDLIDGNSSFIGRPNAYLPGAKETRREATITYSDFNNPEGTKVRYSSFNYALSNFKDLNEEFGGIDYMMNESGDVLVIQNERVSIVPASKTLFSDTAGENTVVASTNVLGTAKTFGLRAGCDGNPESVAVTPENAVFFAHKTLGKVYKYQPGSGVTTISDKNMAAFFRSAFESALATSQEPGYTDIRVPGGYDPLTKEYLITIKDLGDDIIDGEEYDPTAEDIYGCTDSDSLNYNPTATIDDGSCEYEVVDEECLTVKFEYDPSTFAYGLQQLTAEEIDEDGAPLTEYESIVVATNVGEDTATITEISLYNIDYINDFTFVTDLVGTQVEPEASVDIKLLWDPSTTYTINPQASIKIDYVNQDGCSARTEFIPISGVLIGPEAPPPAAPRYIKIYVEGDNPNGTPFPGTMTFQHTGRYGIQYDNHVQGAGFPEPGQVLLNPVKFHVGSFVVLDQSRRLMIETSGITPEDNCVVTFNASTQEDGGQSIAPGLSIFGEPFVVIDESILSQTQDDFGFPTGSAELAKYDISEESLLPGSRSLAGASQWHQGIETNEEWLEHPNTGNPDSGVGIDTPDLLTLEGQNLVYTENYEAILNLVCPADVGTNFSSENGPATATLDITRRYVADPVYAGVNYGWVRNSPEKVRQYCSIPGCYQYDSNGPTNTPVIGAWTPALYQAYTDFTVTQPGPDTLLSHPSLTSSSITPFKQGSTWYNSDSSTFPASDIMASMQINKDCGGVAGCTIPTACNYNPEATFNDGSCIFPEEGFDCDGNPTGDVFGCTNPDSSNYNPDATVDDGSCIIEGCTNPSASNYNPDATVDDGTCKIFGCTDPDAANYNPEANFDDGSCEYDCNPVFPCSLDTNGTGVVTADEAALALSLAMMEAVMLPPFPSFRTKYPAFANCPDEQIIAFFDYNNDGTISTADNLILNTATFPVDCEGTVNSSGLDVCALLDENGEVTLAQVNSVFTGATGGQGNQTFATGIDFDGDGVVTTIDLGVALELIGLTSSSDFFSDCEEDDGGGTTVYGCTTKEACNYNPDATADDGSCVFPVPGYNCDGTPINDDGGPTDFDEPDIGPGGPGGPGDQGYPLCSDFPPQTVRCGCMDPAADNYDPQVQAHVPGSCVYDDDDGGGHGFDPQFNPNSSKRRNTRRRNY